MARPAKSPASSKGSLPSKSRKGTARKSESGGSGPPSRPKHRKVAPSFVGRPPTLRSAKSSTPSKQSRLIELLQQPSGATLADLVGATGWQAHSVRGVISGVLRKKLGLVIESQTNDQGIRRYRILPARGESK
jgi:hypothetical protein